MNSLQIDKYENLLITNALNVMECELMNQRAQSGKTEDDIFDLNTDIDYIQILLQKLDALKNV